MRPKLLLVFFLAILQIATFNSCQYRKPSTLEIGVISAETGDGATDGMNQKQGILLAEEEINSQGLLKNNGTIGIQFYDSQSQPKMDVTEVIKGISLDKIRYFVGDVYSDLTLAMIPVIDHNQVFLISPWAGSPRLSNCSEYFARNYPTGIFEAQFAARHSINILKAKRIAVAYLNSEWGNSLDNYFSSEIKALKGNIILDQGYSKDIDFRTIVSKIKNANPDLIYLGGYETDMGTITKLLREQNVTTQIIANTNYLNPSCLRIAQNSSEGIIIPSPDYDPQNSTIGSVRHFEQMYKSRFHGKEPLLLEAKAYDALMLIKDAYNKVGDDPQRIANYIRNLKNYNGASGIYSFSNGDVTSKIVLKQIQNGQIVNVSK